MSFDKDTKVASSGTQYSTQTLDGVTSPTSLVMDNEPFSYTPEEEKAALRKVDIRLLSGVWIMYLLSYLDRGNIGNAYTGGMGSEFHMTANDYSVVLLLFFITYVLCEVPSNMILTRVRPSIYLPALMAIWGALVMCFAATKSWQAVAGLRLILGILEASFAPGVLFLLSSWYKKAELARRYSIYYSAVAISGIFGGLIAGGLIQGLDRPGSRIQGWQGLFLVEGGATIIVSIGAFFLLPDFPSTTRWLTPRERKIISMRIAQDSIGDAQNGEDVTHKQAAKAAFSDWRTWAFVITYMATTGAQTIQYFIPSLVKSMGYTGFEVQYFTAPIYACALVSILAFCFSADYFKERAWHLSAAAILGFVPFLVMLGVTDHKARYGLLCIGVAGVYASCPLVSIWVSNSIPHPSEKRAIAQAFVNGMGNSASIYGSFLFPSNAKDANRMGFGVTAAFMILALFMAQALRILLVKYPYPELPTEIQDRVIRAPEENGFEPSEKA